MLNMLGGGILSVVRAFAMSKDGKNVLGEEGVSALEKWLTKDQRALKVLSDSINEARDHDKATYGSTPAGQVVDFMRGVVRPVITISAFAWYVYAKKNDIPFTQEDYFIVGGILAFWFGGKFINKDVQK